MLSEYLLQGSDHRAASGGVLSMSADNEILAVVVCYRHVLCALEVEQIYANDFPRTLWDFMWSRFPFGGMAGAPGKWNSF